MTCFITSNYTETKLLFIYLLSSSPPFRPFNPIFFGVAEVLDAQKESSAGGQTSTAEKSAEEQSWERYFERLKESYVRVTKELEGYLEALQETCKRVEQQLEKSCAGDLLVEGSSVERIEQELTELTNFRKTYLPGRMEQDLKARLDNLLSVVGHEVSIFFRDERRTFGKE